MFRQAVVDRLRTEHAGIMMSGGLDSTTSAAVAAKSNNNRSTGDPRAYTLVYDWLFPDEERQFAGLAGKFIGIPVQCVRGAAALTPDEQSPMAVQPPVPVALAHERDGLSPLRQHAPFVPVVLAGTGGDLALHRESNYWLNWLVRGQIGGLFVDIRRHRQVFGRRPPISVPELTRRAFLASHMGAALSAVG